MDFIISLLSSLNSLKVAYLIVPTRISFDEHQAADQLPLKENFTLVLDVTKASSANDAEKPETSSILKNKPFFAEALGKVHVKGEEDKRQTNVTGHEPPLLSNEIK